MTAKVYTIANHKGGCSKTTTLKAMAEILSRYYKKKVLCIDADPQGNLTFWSGVDTDGEYTLYEVLAPKYKEDRKLVEVPATSAIAKTKDYDLIPADIVLADVVVELLNETDAENRLRKKLEPVKEDYDYILIDTPPALNILATNAFVASDGVIIATDSNMFASKGIPDFFGLIDSSKRLYNPKLKISGVLLTKFEKRFVSNQIIEDLTDKLTNNLCIPLFSTRIRLAVGVTAATTYLKPLLDVKPKPKPVEDYELFVNEFLEKERESCNA